MNRSARIVVTTAALVLAALLAFSNSARGFQEKSKDNFASGDLFLPLLYRNSGNPALDTVFGVQMYGNTGTTSPYYPYLVGSQATWVRVPISWYLIEPEKRNPPVYNWASADTFTQAARRDTGGLEFIVTVGGNPDWASPFRNGVIDPEDVSSFVALMAAAVERYDGDGYLDAPGSPVVNHWEIYNEPDNGRAGEDYRWGNDGQKYAQLLAAVWPAVKNANPNVQVVFGGIAYDWFSDNSSGPFVRQFLDDVLAAGGGNVFDVMNFHVYPVFWYNWTDQESPGLLEKANYIKAKLASYGFPNKPLLITEAGWHSNSSANPPGDPEAQARYVVELFTQSIAVGARTMVWWMLHDPTDSWNYENGLIKNTQDPNPLQPKPAYTAFKTAVRMLGSANLHRILPDAETGSGDMEAYELRDHLFRRTIYVAWMDPIDTAMVRPLRVPASSAIVRDIYNGTTTVTDGQDGQIDGLVTVSVGGQPVYIEIPW